MLHIVGIIVVVLLRLPVEVLHFELPYDTRLLLIHANSLIRFELKRLQFLFNAQQNSHEYWTLVWMFRLVKFTIVYQWDHRLERREAGRGPGNEAINGIRNL